MRCVIARYPFDLTKSEVEEMLKGIRPEQPVTGQCAVISRKLYPVKQVGEVITKQDRRDFTAFEVTRALSRLGFTCHETPPAPATPAPAPAPAAETPTDSGPDSTSYIGTTLG
ncbi:SCO5918 family protein [Streptomyces sp. NBC_01261]|uniref:SCO5918 family protein n=1 Tax=unclassified Streptomyces TaxID=2593676 RepID=UPI002E283DC8|nr:MULTISPECIES: SCO5918 family protein [unclassified Streptomyces]